MSNPTSKRGFVAAQPAAAISALDFAHASESLARAHEAAGVVQDEAATETLAEVIAECADRLLGIPTRNPAHIAEKVSAYAWLHNVSPNLSDQAAQWRIAEGDDDRAKGLLAIYLDLIGVASRVSAEEQAWSEEWAAYQAARASAYGDFPKTAEGNRAWEAADDNLARVFGALVRTYAPTATALRQKLQAIFDEGHVELRGDDATDPAFVQRLMLDPSVDGAWPIAYVYQDAIRQTGDTSSPLLQPARPVPTSKGGPRT